MLEESLKKIGLTDGETKVYLALLELGSATSGKITKKCGISGSKVYEVLDRLQNKGLANFIIKNGVKYFDAANPERILDYLSERGNEIEKEKASIQKIIPQLIAKKAASEPSIAKIFTGWEGLKTANEDIITTLKKGEEWLSMGLTEQPKLWEVYFTKRQIVRSKKGIIHKHLLNEKYKALHTRRKRLAKTEFRFLPKELEMPTSIEIYQNKVIIMILTKEDPMAIMMESEAIAKSFQKYFYALWDKAKKI
jgi:sugar-specific transcriptional regulator TrmB